MVKVPRLSSGESGINTRQVYQIFCFILAVVRTVSNFKAYGSIVQWKNVRLSSGRSRDQAPLEPPIYQLKERSMSRPRNRKIPERLVALKNSHGKRYLVPCYCCRIIAFKGDRNRDLRTRKQNETDRIFQ